MGRLLRRHRRWHRRQIPGRESRQLNPAPYRLRRPLDPAAARRTRRPAAASIPRVPGCPGRVRAPNALGGLSLEVLRGPASRLARRATGAPRPEPALPRRAYARVSFRLRSQHWRGVVGCADIHARSCTVVTARPSLAPPLVAFNVPRPRRPPRQFTAKVPRSVPEVPSYRDQMNRVAYRPRG